MRMVRLVGAIGAVWIYGTSGVPATASIQCSRRDHTWHSSLTLINHRVKKWNYGW